MRGISLLVALAALTALALLAPLAGASQANTLQIVVERDIVQYQIFEELTGADAEALRRAVDEAGNGDGFVEAADVSAWNGMHRLGDGVVLAEGCGLETLRWLDVAGHRHPRLGHVNSRVDGSLGAVSSTDPIERGTVVTFVFDEPIGRDTVTLRLASRGEVSDVYVCALGGAVPPLLASAPRDLVIGAEPDFDRGSIEPTSFRAFYSRVDGNTIGPSTSADVALFLENDIRFRLEDDEFDLAAVAQAAAAVGGAAGLALAIAALASSAVREKLWWILGAMPLFTRIERDAVLENERRERLYAYVRENQGATFAELRRAMDLGSGTLVHHLRVLQAQGFVKPIRDGVRSRFYLSGPRITPDTYLTRTQKALLEAIRENPGISQKELTRRSGLTRQSVHYHGQSLAAKGVLEVRQVGRWRRYFLRPSATPRPAPP